MKRIITMIMAVAMVLTSVAAPVEYAKAEAVKTQNPDGSYTITYDVVDGRQTVETVYPDGSRTVCIYENLTLLEATDYHADGSKEWYSYQDGTRKEYYKNGNIKMSTNVDGSTDFYYESGKLKQHLNADNTSVGYYESGAVQYRSGAGESYTAYDEKGNIRIVRDKNGAYTKAYNITTTDSDGTHKEWDKKGNVVFQRKSDGTVMIDKELQAIRVSARTKKEDDTLISDIDRETFWVVAGLSASATLVCTGYGKGKVTWTTGNSAIATINQKGVVKGKKAGKTTVTAKLSPSGIKLTLPLRVLKNECDNTIRTRGSKKSAVSEYCKITTDKKGDLVCKVRLKNVSKRKIAFKAKRNVKIRMEDPKKAKFTKKNVLPKKFSLKPGKSKVFTIKIKKSKLKVKKINLPKSYIHVDYEFFAELKNGTLHSIGTTCTAKGDYTIY